MLYFPRANLIFLANPKTGTTAFEKTFSKFADREISDRYGKHLPFRALNHKAPELIVNNTVVTVVRHPLETLFSWYRYRSRRTLFDKEKQTKHVSFEQFFASWCEVEPPKYARVGTSVEFVTTWQGKLAEPLKKYRYEESDLFFEQISKQLSVNPKLSVRKRNISPIQNVGHKKLTEYEVDLSQPKYARVAELYDRINFEEFKT